MRYAVHDATEPEKTTYYSEKIDRMKVTTRRRKIEIKIEKITKKSRREERKKFKSGKEATEKQETKRSEKH